MHDEIEQWGRDHGKNYRHGSTPVTQAKSERDALLERLKMEESASQARLSALKGGAAPG